MAVIALIPARAGSKGIPGKNLRRLGGMTLIERAVRVAEAAGCDVIVTSADLGPSFRVGEFQYIERPASLAQDDTPMIDVVTHAMAQVPGDPSDAWVLLQPTQPLRTPEHVKAAVTLLQESGADSLVSVVELPKTYHPVFQFRVQGERLHRGWSQDHRIGSLPATRQAVTPTYIRDGTVYAFRRATVERYRDIYGQDCRPLVIDPKDSCELDTEEQWDALLERWKARP